MLTGFLHSPLMLRHCLVLIAALLVILTEQICAATPSTVEIQLGIVGTESEKKYCIECHGRDNPTSLHSVDLINSNALRICGVVLSEGEPLMAKLGKYATWSAEEKLKFQSWCKEKGWRAPESLTLNHRIDRIYEKNCLSCHPRAEPWIHPPYFCQTVYNESMPWQKLEKQGVGVQVQLIKNWSPEERSDFAAWCREKNEKNNYLRLQVPY